ncbi:AbrB/MazE/SpoVT family DNA-binding domain-containing protein [Halomicrobium sp. IBSBa]|uniref:SpoVT-AbrB domain-containing protein n=1 Tax=Halomicrobium mukohataei TaxID=57705 RepID=A0A847UHU7_9EURY|nr:MULTISPECIES: AbrB/MazE/SpoVT family DNA-binding domain-containing protein [Halomicrobium]MBO4248380.1 AbrB/MazE/SpoVT family DNA-binding domain-containing protein [Halomicrobium sp. IBSBa]NLV10678.1 hypothetical protein [Halomicrobium mukohataei]
MGRKPCSRTVTDLGGSVGVSIPKGLADAFEIEQGDEVLIEWDIDDGKMITRLD